MFSWSSGFKYKSWEPAYSLKKNEIPGLLAWLIHRRFLGFSLIQRVFARGYGEVRKMGSAILVPKVTPKAHPFVWLRGIEISRVALGTRMGKLRFSTDVTLRIPLCLCVVKAFFPEGLGYTRFQVMGMHDRMGAKVHNQKIPRASRKTTKTPWTNFNPPKIPCRISEP